MVPHGGYHWNRGAGRFFEGWYYRLILPEIQQSFAFMYAIDDPQGGTACSGGSMQVLGIDDRHLWRTLPNVSDFYASPDRLYLEHWGKGGQGYSASDRHNKGRLVDAVTGKSCIWDYKMEVLDTWGDRRRPEATMGYLSYLPIFEPGWQILIARGLATGAIAWQGETYKFQNAPAYCEKNWGRSFPHKWFWLQCNAFPGYEDLSITVAGGIREHLGYKTSVAMVGIHDSDRFYSFMPENSEIYCDIQPWGQWRIQARNQSQQVEVNGSTQHNGTQIMVPTASGLKFCCKDTARGELRLSLRADRQITAYSSLGALEIGGTPWDSSWHFQSAKV